VPRDAASVRIWWEDTPDPERPLWAYLVWETDADGWHDVAHGWLSEDALNADTDAELIAVFRAECPRYASIPDERITIQ
jgi:hypothetical protein